MKQLRTKPGSTTGEMEENVDGTWRPHVPKADAKGKASHMVEGPRHGKSLEQQLQEQKLKIEQLQNASPSTSLLDAARSISASEEEAVLLADLLHKS